MKSFQTVCRSIISIFSFQHTPPTRVTIPNMVDLCQTVDRESSKTGGSGALSSWQADVVDSTETGPFPTCITTPNLVAKGQAVWANVGSQQIWGTLGPRPLLDGT